MKSRGYASIEDFGDRSASHEFARAKEEDRKKMAAIRLLIWIVATIVFMSYGGYFMYQAMDIRTILGGFALLVCAVVSVFLGICAAMDLVE